MSVYASAEIDGLVKIDANHIQLIAALVTTAKPRQVLEFGFGAGEATRAIRGALAYNNQPHQYNVVDNWLDFGGIPPQATREADFAGVDFITSSEDEYVHRCQNSFDFILSDADHYRAHSWFDRVYLHLLAPGGILIYHDVTNTRDFPDLLGIYARVLRDGLHHVLLNRRSLPGERCERGLLVIFKH